MPIDAVSGYTFAALKKFKKTGTGKSMVVFLLPEEYVNDELAGGRVFEEDLIQSLQEFWDNGDDFIVLTGRHFVPFRVPQIIYNKEEIGKQVTRFFVEPVASRPSRVATPEGERGDSGGEGGGGEGGGGEDGSGEDGGGEDGGGEDGGGEGDGPTVGPTDPTL